MIRQNHRPILVRSFVVSGLAALLSSGAVAAYALPINAVFAGTNGSGLGGTYTTAGTTGTIDQTNSRVVIKWDSFNIASGENVVFNQPDKGSIAFNVVPAGQLTTIAGSLNANGGVWLFSPAGIVINAGAAISTGSFVASTGVFDTSNATQMNQALNTNTVQIAAQATPGQGYIEVDEGTPSNGSMTGTPAATIDATAGFVLLQSPTITQNGQVSATDAVVYNADEDIQATFVPTASGITLTSESSTQGLPSESHIDVGGSTSAGTWFEADAAEDVSRGPSGYAGVINLSGVVTASGMKADSANPDDPGNGFSVILNGDDGGPSGGGEVTKIDGSAGAITASNGIYGNAGSITTGAWTSNSGGVQLNGGGAGIVIDPPLISNGSGSVNIAGKTVAIDDDIQAAASVSILSYDTTVAPGVTVQAGAADAGPTHSTLVMKSTGDINAPFSSLFVGPSPDSPTGSVAIDAGATVGPQDNPTISETNPGTGGDLTLGLVSGTYVSLQATPLNGVGGTLDLEGPVESSGSVIMGASRLVLGPSSFIAAGFNSSNPNYSEISTGSGSVNVVLENPAAPAALPAAAGDIVLAAPVNYTGDGDFTLDAWHSIIVTAPITVDGPDTEVDLYTNDGGSGGDYSFTNGGSLSFTAGESNQSLYINNNPYALIFSQAELLAINNNLSGDYALAAPLDFAAGNTATVFTGAPIGSTVYAPFTGAFTGLGNTISNLTIQEVTPIGQQTASNFGTDGALGLFGVVASGGMVRDVNLSNVNITGGNGVMAGALVGDLEGGTVMNASSSGQIGVGDYDPNMSTGADANNFAYAMAGGLIGLAANSQVVNAHSSATVSAGQVTQVGGLAGFVLGGSVDNSSASGSATGGETASVGGLAGYVEAASVSGSSATGSATGGDFASVGGLAGDILSGTINGSFATGAVGGGAGSNIGGFGGFVSSTTIGASYATGAVTQTLAGFDDNPNTAGGFVGYLGQSSITQSYSSGAVQTVGGPDSGAFTLAGGFAGEVDNKSSVSDAYSLGAVTSTTTANADLGGFAGVVQNSSSVSQAYATGHISGFAGSTTAGLVAVLGTSNESAPVSSLSDSYWDTATTGQSVGYNITPAAMVGDGVATATAVTPISGAGVYSAATYANFDMTGTWTLIPGVTRPLLRSEYSTTITNAHQLQLMELDPTADYTLANDIDASATANDLAGIWNPATGFSPIGGNTNPETVFTGTFNGQGHTITNLSITFTTAYPQTPFSGLTTDGAVGLFGFVGPAGVIENVNLANAQVTAGDGMLAGALVGGLLGSVTNASSSGSVTVGNEVNTGGGGDLTADAGGLVGGSAGSITNSHSSATVTGGNAFAGGLLGTAGDGGVVINSYATGAVSVGAYPAGGVDNPDAGGLVGEFGGSNGNTNPSGGIADSYATGAVSGGGGSSIGGLVGSIGDIDVVDSYATGAVTQTGGGVNGSNSAAGGFAGSVENGAQVSNDYATGDVISQAAPANNFTRAGGFAGEIEGEGTGVYSAYALGSVTINGSGAGVSPAGGFAGAIDGDGEADHVYATGHVAGPQATGGLVGQVGAVDNGVSTGGSIYDSYWDEGTTGQTVGEILVGTASTQFDNTGIGGTTGLSPYDPATYTSFDFTTGWFIVAGSTRPILQSEYSTTIANAHQLQLMDMNLNADYTLGADIDATNVDGASGIWNPATGFSPIGAAAAMPFTGQFNGQGHTIHNLTVIDTTAVDQTGSSGEESEGAVGLFGFVGSGAVLQNVTLFNATVTGGDGMEVGALAGDVAGEVINASSSGGLITVGDGYSGADGRAGGLVGDLTGTIMNSSSSASVTGGDADVGGLVGKSIDGTVTGSFATGSVNGGAGSVAGGLIGWGDNFTVSYSYATGSVTQSTAAANNFAGGFAGDLEFSTVNSSFAGGPVSTAGTTGNPALAGGFVGNLLSTTVNNAYATGSVTVNGPDDIEGGFAGTVGADSVVNNVYAIGKVDPAGGGVTAGGLFGTVSDAGQPDLPGGGSPAVTDAYWNSATTTQPTPYTLVGSASITSVADISGDPYDAGSYQGFNFETVWSIPSAGFYPQLYGASHVLNITVQPVEITYGNFPVYTLAVNGLQGGDTIAAAVHGFVVQPLDPQNSDASPSVGYSGYYNVNNNQNGSYDFSDPYDLSIAQTVVASGSTGTYRPIYNDNFHNVDGTLVIDPAILSVAAVYDERPYDGDVDSAGQPTVTGLVPGDGFTGGSLDSNGNPTQSFNSPDVDGADSLIVNPFAVNDGNRFAQGANYTVSTENADGEIDPETIVVGAQTDSRQYDGTTSSSGTPTIVSGMLYGTDANDTVTGSQAFESKDVLGTNGSTLQVTDYTLTLNDPGNYSISDTTATAMGTITPAPLQIDAVGDSRVYNGGTSSTGTPVVDSSSTVFEGDSVTDLTQAFASKDVLGTNGSTLQVTGYLVNDGNGGADYTVTTADAEGTITPAPLQIDATGDSRVYNGTTSSSAMPSVDETTPVLGTDTVTDLTQAFASKDVLGTNGSTLQVTGYLVNDGAGGADYTVTTADAEGTITPAAVVVSATSATKVYDGDTTSTAAPTAGLFEGDTLEDATQAYASKDVLGLNGSTLSVTGYTINDGNGGADYTVTTADAAGTITPAPLQIDAAGDSRVYNGTTSSVGTPTVDPSSTVFEGDSVTGLTQDFVSKDVLGVGLSALQVTGYSVNDGNNGNDYAVTTVNAAGTITPAPLQIDATSDSRVYNGLTSSSATPTVDETTPVLGTDTVTGLTQAFASKDVLGTNGSTLQVTGYLVNDGADGADYTVTTADAEGTITPVDITLSATTDSRVYNGTTSSSAAPTASELFSNDSLVATQSYTVKDVLGAGQSTLQIDGGYSINDGAGGADYNITNVYTASGTITPLALTASLAGTVQKPYDGGTSATLASDNYSLPGVIGEDDVSLNDPASGTYDNRNAGTGKTVSVTGLQLLGDDAEDYSVNATASAPVGIITQAPLTLTAITETRTYDGTTAADVTPTNSALIEGDSVSDLTETFDSRNAGSRTLSVASYTIDDGNNGGNYAVTLITAPGTINPAPLTLSAVPDSKIYDGTVLSGDTPGESGLVGGDSITGFTQAYDSKTVGTRVLSVAGYTIDDGNGGANYVVTTTTAAGSITAKTLDASLIGGVSKSYDGNTDATLADDNYSLTGVVSGDQVSLNDPTSGSYDTPAAGSGKLVSVSGLALSGADAANYIVNGTAAAPIGTITAPPQPIVIIVPPLDLTQSDFDEVAAATNGVVNFSTTVVNVFPVGNVNNTTNYGDNAPITGAGNGDLWTGSDQSDTSCPPGTSGPNCSSTAGNHP
jgi:filamentous hemagglutinin family protein